jgi:predicted small lipoprotein YifL
MNARWIIVMIVAALSLGGLSGCGKKSALTPPPDSEYPKQYPRQ